jgi:hypothetical protein
VELFTDGALNHGSMSLLRAGGWCLNFENPRAENCFLAQDAETKAKELVPEEVVKKLKSLETDLLVNPEPDGAREELCSTLPRRSPSAKAAARISRRDKLEAPWERIARKLEDGDPDYEVIRSLDEARQRTSAWCTGRTRSAMSRPHAEWMQKLKEGDLSGPPFPVDQYLRLRDTPVEGNPRQTEEYRQACLEAVGLGSEPDEERYGHLREDGDYEQNLEALRWAVRRGTGCFWLPDTPRASIRCFLHRLITRGPPVRVGLHRLNGPDTEWIENAVQEDVARGQLTKGFSLWGSPAFPTKATAAHKPIQRGRRIVVDYRALNRVTEKRVFIIPNADGLKSAVAGSRYISVGDLKEGFNQVLNEPETAQKMAVLTASGCYPPRGLTFGPTNGPEDFQELVFIIFSRRLNREWYLFLDDLTVAPGKTHLSPSRAFWSRRCGRNVHPPSGTPDYPTAAGEDLYYCRRVRGRRRRRRTI